MADLQLSEATLNTHNYYHLILNECQIIFILTFYYYFLITIHYRCIGSGNVALCSIRIYHEIKSSPPEVSASICVSYKIYLTFMLKENRSFI